MSTTPKTRLSSEDKYNLLSGRVPMMLNRLLSQNFKKQGIELTKEQWSLLAILWKQDGVSQQFLADLTHRDKPSTTRLIDTLEKNNYVERRAHPQDRRQNLIFLTGAGRRVEADIMQVVDLTMQQVTENMSEAQIETIRSAFDIIYRNILKSI